MVVARLPGSPAAPQVLRGGKTSTNDTSPMSPVVIQKIEFFNIG